MFITLIKCLVSIFYYKDCYNVLLNKIYLEVYRFKTGNQYLTQKCLLFLELKTQICFISLVQPKKGTLRPSVVIYTFNIESNCITDILGKTLIKQKKNYL